MRELIRRDAQFDMLAARLLKRKALEYFVIRLTHWRHSLSFGDSWHIRWERID